MENRGAQHHKERMAEALREELTTMLAGELNDPRIGLATLNELVMGPGNRSMRAYVAVEGEPEEAQQTIDGLNAAVGYIRNQIAVNLGIRKAPDLSFHLDRGEKHAARIDELLERIHKRSK